MRRTYGNSWGDRAPYWMREQPVTMGVIFATVAVFLLYFLTAHTGSGWINYVAYTSSQWMRVWTWFTYPLVELHPLWMAVSCWVLYQFGGMLERSWSSRNFAVLFFAFTAIGAVAFIPAYYLLGGSALAAGHEIPLCALIVAWAAMDPYQPISLFGVFQMQARWLGIISALLLYFNYGFMLNPVGGLFALAAPAAAYYYVRKMPRLSLGFRAPRAASRPAPRRGSTTSRPTLRVEESPRERVPGTEPRTAREREEIERLRRLLGDDDSPPARR